MFKVCLAGLLSTLQRVMCKGEADFLEVEWPRELLLATRLIVLSTVCL